MKRLIGLLGVLLSVAQARADKVARFYISTKNYEQLDKSTIGQLGRLYHEGEIDLEVVKNPSAEENDEGVLVFVRSGSEAVNSLYFELQKKGLIENGGSETSHDCFGCIHK